MDRVTPESLGPSSPQVSMSILEIIIQLHDIGYESIYIDSYMAHSGCSWRYEIGAIVNGQWPTNAKDLVTGGSIGGIGYDQIPWTRSQSGESLMADFLEAHPHIKAAASEPIPGYVAWYREMLESTAPDGILIFCSEYGADHEYAYTWGPPQNFRMPMPPGFSG